jgi:hypothetical protein
MRKMAIEGSEDDGPQGESAQNRQITQDEERLPAACNRIGRLSMSAACQ